MPENETSPGRSDELVADGQAEERPPTSRRSESARATAGANPYMPGEVIADRYRLVRELGHGGMGVVWVAHSLVLGVDVALKLIRANVAGSAAAMRMAREAHAAARIGHPALVHVFDFGWTHRRDPYLVMELVQGETLSARLARVPRIPSVRAAQMVLPIADGLRVAHDKHIVHRDIKPDNIFLASDTLGRLQPKLLDFGIAKVGPTLPSSRLTRDGVVMGSPEYMSPEQAFGLEEVDGRTDVWSLAIVLYEMITGRVPFQGANYNALMQNIVSETPPPVPDRDIMDAELWRVVERGLAKEREERWPSMAEFGTALAVWLNGHGVREDVSGNSLGAVWLDGPSSDAADLHPVAQAAEKTKKADRRASARVSEPPLAADTPSRAAPARSEAIPPARGRRLGVVVALTVLAGAAALALWAALTASEPGEATDGAMEPSSAVPSQASAGPAADPIHQSPSSPRTAPDTDAAISDVQRLPRAPAPRHGRARGTRSNARGRTPGYDFGF
ncbi:MAG: protein kinase [Polyangiaceae bacterium]|nr:protein kinase [Polyangiaceae bacterium]